MDCKKWKGVTNYEIWQMPYKPLLASKTRGRPVWNVIKPSAVLALVVPKLYIMNHKYIT